MSRYEEFAASAWAHADYGSYAFTPEFNATRRKGGSAASAGWQVTLCDPI